MRIILATIAFVMIGMPSWGYSSDLFSPSASDRIDNDNTSLNSLALCTVFRTLIISKDDIIEDDKANQIIVRFADGIPVAYQSVGLEANEHITNAQFRMGYDKDSKLGYQIFINEKPTSQQFISYFDCSVSLSNL